MTKMVLEMKREYTYDPNRRGAKYTFNGVNWLNAGEFREAMLKDCLGCECKKDSNTAFDAGSDIEELAMSVKSSKATLTNEILGKNLEDSLNCYFNRCASTSWAWVIDIENTLHVYVMNEDEFRTFTEQWANYNEEKKIRYKTSSGKMIAWLENRVSE